MKQGIHPAYHPVKIVMTDGFEYETYSTLGKEGETVVLKLPVDSRSHPAYTDKPRHVDTEGRVDKFNKKYGRG